MNIQDIMASNPNGLAIISLSDLKVFLREIVRDHVHYSNLERIYALCSIDMIQETMIGKGKPFLFYFIPDYGMGIHEYLDYQISMLHDKSKVMAKIKAKHPEIPDSDIPYHADITMDDLSKRMKTSAIKFFDLARKGMFKLSKK